MTSELEPAPPAVSAPRSSPSSSESRPVGPLGTALLGIFMLLLGLLLATALFSVWPAIEQTTQQNNGQGRAEIIFGISVTSGTALIVFVIVASALGSYVHAATSLRGLRGSQHLHPPSRVEAASNPSVPPAGPWAETWSSRSGASNLIPLAPVTDRSRCARR